MGYALPLTHSGRRHSPATVVTDKTASTLDKSNPFCVYSVVTDGGREMPRDRKYCLSQRENNCVLTKEDSPQRGDKISEGLCRGVTRIRTCGPSLPRSSYLPLRAIGHYARARACEEAKGSFAGSTVSAREIGGNARCTRVSKPIFLCDNRDQEPENSVKSTRRITETRHCRRDARARKRGSHPRVQRASPRVPREAARTERKLVLTKHVNVVVMCRCIIVIHRNHVFFYNESPHSFRKSYRVTVLGVI